ncbi:CAP domain-containing protein [Micromonospora sp. NPDC000316]|uniref:CAP domain-containing protein n=1 Tax=Micromonospora sp. NPDC000316 TaxID=3364216 RepID=UPI0036953A11
MSGSGAGGEGSGTRIAVIGAAIGGGMALMSSPIALALGGALVVVVGALYILLLPLILLIWLFGGFSGSGGGPDIDVQDAARQSIEAGRGDGKGELDTDQVPASLLETIEDAGKECTEIGPVVIAAQIQVGSGWYTAKVGEDGKVGISQLDPEIFEKYGEDTDDNDKTRPEDPKDSIMAQAKYMCALAKEVQTLLDDGQVIGDALDLTLSAYQDGIDAVRDAGGVSPSTNTRAYTAKVRAYFGQYMGILGEPYATPTTTGPSPEATTDTDTDADDDSTFDDGGVRAAVVDDDSDDAGGGTSAAATGRVLELVNARRSEAGCAPVHSDPELTTAAQRHSQDQADHRSMSHTGSDGSDVGQRLDRAGYAWRTYGENVAYNQPTPEAVMDAWMNSPGHRANILNCAFTEIGVGRADTGDGPYWTQNFAAPS